MENTSIIGGISVIIVTLFLLLGAFLLTVKTTKNLSNRLLASFLIITAIDISVFFYHNFIELPFSLEMFRVQISSFKDPLLFLYILSVIYSDFKLKTKHIVLLLPWATSIIILLPNFFLESINEQLPFLLNYSETFEGRFITRMNRITEIIYIIAEVYYLIRYRKLLLENYTNKEAFYYYHWLKQLIIFILVGQTLTFIKGTIRDSGNYDENYVNIFRIILLSFGLFFTFWLVFKALISPKLFRGIAVNLRLSKEMRGLDNSNNKKEHNKQIQHIKNFMINQEPFLDASLTVKSLSEKIDIPHRELSILINQELGLHFFDFINKYRIEKAMSILKDASKKKQTILEILYEVGFNSKSSFNTAFKKHTNTTPTTYRKLH